MNTPINMLQAINLALLHSMEEDKRVVLLGEDIGKNGGVFRATQGLYEQFGKKRVLDTPLAESLIAGMSIGMALYGLRPVCEFQFMGFMLPACEQLFAHASRLQHRSEGKTTCPMVCRAPYGGGVHAPEHHAESTEALFAHIPGLRVVIPSTPQAAYSLLKQAIRSLDPVIFLEPKRLYHSQQQSVTCQNPHYQYDQARIEQYGQHITVVGWGAMMPLIREASTILAKQSIQVEIIDLVSLQPIDYATLQKSVERTKRLLVVQEAPPSCSIGAELLASLCEKVNFYTRPQRLTPTQAPPPPHRYEQHFYPTTSCIVQRISQMMELTSYA